MLWRKTFWSPIVTETVWTPIICFQNGFSGAVESNWFSPACRQSKPSGSWSVWWQCFQHRPEELFVLPLAFADSWSEDRWKCQENTSIDVSKSAIPWQAWLTTPVGKLMETFQSHLRKGAQPQPLLNKSFLEVLKHWLCSTLMCQWSSKDVLLLLPGSVATPVVWMILRMWKVWFKT